MDNKKAMGQVYTPVPIVKMMLDAIGYSEDSDITDKKIMEPSFGDGAFVVEAVSRLISACKRQGLSPQETSDVIKRNVYGIEVEEKAYREAVARLDALLLSHLLPPVDWAGNLLCGNTLLLYKDLTRAMDYVVGNPPYVRIHNLDIETRHALKDFSCTGMTDLYIAFYLMGADMLSSSGRLVYISPNSLFRNASASNLRKFLANQGLVSFLWDFKSSKLFDNADTYCCICGLDKAKHNGFTYREYSGIQMLFEESYPLSALSSSGNWVLGRKKDALFLSEIRSRPARLGDMFVFQNGVATNKDSVFIGNVTNGAGLRMLPEEVKAAPQAMFNGHAVETAILRPCVKIQKYSGGDIDRHIIFPYRKNGDRIEVIPEEVLREKYPLAYDYLLSNKDRLLARDISPDTPWYAFGRTQALSCGFEKKLVFKSIVKRDAPLITPLFLDEDVVVYSGIYARCGKDEGKLFTILSSPEFSRYCTLVGKDISGGYVQVSSGQVSDYRPSSN